MCFPSIGRGSDSRHSHMIFRILYDLDGVVINSPERRFSETLAKDYGASYEQDILPFFNGTFQDCLIGKADLKEELKPYLAKWRWPGGVDELLRYWFAQYSNLNRRLLAQIKDMKTSGVPCFLVTNNEAYRTKHAWEGLGLNAYFDGIFSSARVGYQKTQREFWAAVWLKLGAAAKKQVLCWDDDKKNVTTAADFGFQAEWYESFESYQDNMARLLARKI